MSIARVPFLPGVVDTIDPTYTVVGTSLTGFISSAVAHTCATVPTVKTLFRFCRNGFKHDTKASSGYVKEHTSDSSGKRSYKSLQDSKNHSTYSGKQLDSSQQRSKVALRDKKDPFHIPSMIDVDAENEEGFMELRPVKTHSDGERYVQQDKIVWSERVDAQSPTTIRETPEPELDDSASNRAILRYDLYPRK
jgi:hypothetical protein